MQRCISVETKIRRKVEANICSDEQKLRAMVSLLMATIPISFLYF